MKVAGSVVLVTGANRGIGRAYVAALLERGAGKIYATARRVEAVADLARAHPGKVETLALDITDPKAIAAAASRCADVTLLVNNAGVNRGRGLLAAPDLEAVRQEMETNYFGTLAMCRAFAPVLKRNGGGALVNILSVVSWFNAPMQGTYCASKAAGWSLTKAVRFELNAQGTLVVAVYPGYIDTDMTANIPGPKASAATIAQRVLAGIAAGDEEVLTDERATAVNAELLKDRRPFDANMQKVWDEYVKQRAARG